MTLLSRLFGTKYNDDQLIAQATTAITEDPLVREGTGVVVASEKGIIKLTGIVHRNGEKDRIEGVVRNALGVTGAKYDRIVNEIQVN
jgi:osmotically-inducible protein OsmY